MSALSIPTAEYSVSVTPELRALFAEMLGAGASPEPDPVGPPTQTESAQLDPESPSPVAARRLQANAEASTADAGLDDPLLWPLVRLRRDGLRPLEFHGLRVVSAFTAARVEELDVDVRQSFALYLKREGGIVAEASVTMPHEAENFAWYRATEIADVHDLREVTDFRPMIDGRSRRKSFEVEALAVSLQSRFRDLTQMVLFPCQDRSSPQGGALA